MCIVKISLENGKNLFVVNIYIPPNRSSLAALGLLLGSLPDLTHCRRQDEFIIAGDFNLKLNEYDNPLLAMDIPNLKRIHFGATRLNNEIDYVYTNCRLKNRAKLEYKCSDHRALMAHIISDPPQTVLPPPVFSKVKAQKYMESAFLRNQDPMKALKRFRSRIVSH